MADAGDELNLLRQELDDLDQRLLATAARRNEIVQQIARTKLVMGATAPLFDRQRERAVYERAEAIAKQVGLPEALSRRLMQALVEASHQIQEAAMRETTAPETSHAPRRFLIIGGKGRMGQFFSRELAGRGHAVDVMDVDDPRDRAAVVGAAEIVIVAVPMHAAVDVVKDVAPLVAPDALLFDINSLKENVCAAMHACRGEALGLHPMFGPTVRTLRRQKVVVCPVKAGPLCDWLRGELGRMGAEIIETDPATHDRMMAVVQVLVHFSTLVMGRALRETGVSVEESLQFTSPIYRLELAFVGRLFAQNPELYAEIVMSNPHGAAVRRRFREAALRMDGIITAQDRAAFRSLFDDVSGYFEGFAGEAMGLSDSIIDMIVTQP